MGAQGEGAFHLQPGPEEHLVDRALIRRIGHRQRHLPAGLQDGQHAVLSQEGLGEEPRDPWVDGVGGRVDVRVPQLVAERPGHVVLGDVLLLDQDLTDPHAGRRLRGHGARQLLRGGEPVRHQDLPELVGLLLRGAHRRLNRLPASGPLRALQAPPYRFPFGARSTLGTFLKRSASGRLAARDVPEHIPPQLQPHTVLVGKVHVEEDEIGLALLRDRKRFPSGSRHPDLESRRHEDSLRQEDVHRLIIDDQDAWGFEGRHPWCLFAHRWFNRWMLNLLVLPR